MKLLHRGMEVEYCGNSMTSIPLNTMVNGLRPKCISRRGLLPNGKLAARTQIYKNIG